MPFRTLETELQADIVTWFWRPGSDQGHASKGQSETAGKGGIQEAKRCIDLAKSLGMKTVLGCMVSSSLSVTAAAHLSPLVDYADLDGNLLISNDPYTGVRVQNGKLIIPDRRGLGLSPA
jgi:L-alanine-DL-glutamate epimerase-like enolase superfamily enzyme